MLHRRLIIPLSLAFVIAIAFGAHSKGLFAQAVSYAPGVEGQIWQQLPTFGRGLDMGNERPITTVPGFSDPNPLGGIADIWPCTSDEFGFPDQCFPSGQINVGPGAPPDVMQNYAGRFAPCVGDQCYPSGLVGIGDPVKWAVGPCTMQESAARTDCYPLGTIGAGDRVAPADGQLAGPLGIAVDNTANVGTIYVTDHWNHRVQAFLFDGSVVTLPNPIGDGIAGVGPFSTAVDADHTVTGERLNAPESIKVDANRNILVADSGNGRVARFDNTGKFIDSLDILDPFQPVDEAGNPLLDDNGNPVPLAPASPTGVALTPGASFKGANNPPNSLLVVTDKYNCTIYFYDAATLQQLKIVGGTDCNDVGGTPAPESVSAVEGVTIDNAGHVYVADYDRNRIEIYDTTGTLLTTFGDPLAHALPPLALDGPTDVLVDHRGVFTQTDASGDHQVARVFVVDTLAQRIAVYSVNFDQATPDQATPVATFLFALNAAGDLNGFPTNIAEDTSHDPVGKLVTTDSGNARIQRFQVPDLAIVNVTPDPATRTVTFGVVVPVGKDPVGVKTVTPIVCPTSTNTTVTSGTLAAQTGCATAHTLTPTATILPGDIVTYSFQFASGQNVATFDVYATGNPLGSSGAPNTFSNHVTATVTNPCPDCSITPSLVTPAEALVAPVAPSTLYVSTHPTVPYTSVVTLSLNATSTLGLSSISYQFTDGPEIAIGAQPGVHPVSVSGNSASVQVQFRLSGTSTLDFWATNVDGTETAHAQVQLTLSLVPPDVAFRFSQAVRPNTAGWWNKAFTLPLDFTGHITAVVPIGAGMPANPDHSSPLSFSTEGRNLGFTVTVADDFGLSVTKSSNDTLNDGQPVFIDMTGPVFVPAPSITLQRASFAGAPAIAGTAAAALALAGDPKLTNGEDGSGLATVLPAPSAPAIFAFGTSTASFIATDLAGNSTTGNVAVNVVDTIAPVLTCPTTLDLQAGLLGTVFGQPGFTVSDASMIGAPANVTPVTVTQSPAIGASLPFLSVLNVTLTATDPSGNPGTCVTQVTGRLLGPPHFTSVPSAQTIQAGATPNLAATAVDSAGVSLTVTNNRPATFPLGPTTVIFSATDLAGQTVTASVVITVIDTTKPVIAAHGNVAVEATSGAGAVANYTPPQVTDNFDAPHAATCSPAPTAAFPFGPTTVTCTATDSNGNAANPTTFVVTVADTTRPVIAAHADVTAEATSATTTVVTYTSPATSDAVDGPQTAACLPASNTAFNFGNTTVTCRITDSHGNVATPTTFVVHVVDTTAPVIAAHADVTVSPTSASGAVVAYTAPTATDAFDGTKSATCTPASGTTFVVGNTTVTCRITDSHGNVATPTTFVVHVVDTTAPLVTVPANMTVEATGPSGAIRTFTATATDNVSGTLTPVCAPASGSTFQLGTTSVTCSATDAAGNTGQASFLITVRDTTPPVVTVPANLTVTPSGGTTTTVTFPSSASDLVSGPVATTCSPASGSGFPAGPTTVTCTASDAAGNTGTASFTVTVGSVASTPVCTAAVASPAVLWPPNHKFATISIKGITNADGTKVTTAISSIFQDEPTQGLGDGDTAIDAVISNGTAQVRAERSGTGDGRVYYINFKATSAGGSCTGTVTVAVPHDQAHAAVGGGPQYDSTKASSPSGDNCHGESGHGHHDGDGCLNGHHGHYDGDECNGRDGYDHDGDGHGGGRDGGSHRR